MRPQALLSMSILTASACGEDEDNVEHLGPIDAGPVLEASPPPVVPPEPFSLVATPCTSSAAVVSLDNTSVVRSIATLESRALLTLNGEVRSVQLGADGCPGAPIVSFGENGSLAIDALSAVALPGARSLVATSTGTQLLDSTGSHVDDCVGSVGAATARALHANADGEVAAVFTKSPIALLELGMSTVACVATEQPLSPPPFAVAAIAMGRSSGFVTVELASSSSPLVVARYGADGVKIASSAAFASQGASKLCSATGLVDTVSGVFVTDSTCRRAVLFDGELLVAVAVRTFDETPRGAGLAPDQGSVLVALERPCSPDSPSLCVGGGVFVAEFASVALR